MAIGIYPTWQQFFDNILKSDDVRPSDKEVIKLCLKKKDYEKVASTYYRSVGQGRFIDRIKYVFSEDKIIKDQYDKLPIRLLPSIFKNSTVITTNFDRLLEEVYLSMSMI